MTYTEAIAALRPLQTEHPTLHGEREGFYMSDAVDVLGGYLEHQANFTVAPAMAALYRVHLQWCANLLCRRKRREAMLLGMD